MKDKRITTGMHKFRTKVRLAFSFIGRLCRNVWKGIKKAFSVLLKMLGKIINVLRTVLYFLFHPIPVELLKYKGIYNIILEISFVLLNLIIFIFASITYFNFFDMGEGLSVHFSNIDSIMLTLFQVQASVATVGIVVISLISGFIKQKYYGVSVTNFIMNNQYKLTKMKALISIELIYIIASFFLLSLQIYTYLIAVFISSVLIYMQMTTRILHVFERGYNVKDDILHHFETSVKNTRYAYKKQEACESIIRNAINEVETALIAEDYEIIDDCMHVIDHFGDLYLEFCDKYSSQNWLSGSNNYLYLLTRMIATNNVWIVNRCLQSVNHMYMIATHLKLRCSISETLLDKVFEYTTTFNPISQSTIKNLREFRKGLYSNIIEDPDSWYDAVQFLPRLYSSLLQNNLYLSLPSSFKKDFWQGFIFKDTLNQTDYSFMTDSRFLSKPRKIEFVTLVKLIIESSDVDLFDIMYSIRSMYDIKLLSALLCYGKIFETKRESNQSLSVDFERILRKCGYDFYFECTANSKDDLKNWCRTILENMDTNKYVEFEKRSIINYLNEEQGEFMFFYILYHLDRLKKQEIKEIYDWFLHKEHDNAYKVFYCSGNTKVFIKRYRYFCQLVFGGWNMMDEGKYATAVAFCDIYFGKHTI